MEVRGGATFVYLGNLQHTTLDLSKYGALVTDMILYEIVSRPATINRLILSGCVQLTDAGIKLTSDELSNLKVLFLDGCVKLTEKSFKCLSQMESLRYLSLSCLPNLTASSIELINEELQTLDISLCKQMDDKAGALILNRFKRLGYLDVRGCNMSHYILEEMRAFLSFCRIVNEKKRDRPDEPDDSDARPSKKHRDYFVRR